MQEDRIIGGKETTIDKIPYLVSVRLNGRHRCGGSIISQKHVLTSSNCLEEKRNPIDYNVLAGSTSRLGDENQQLKKVSKIVKHPIRVIDFMVPIDDIGIIFIDGQFEFNRFVQPIKLPEKGSFTPIGAIGTLSGWGRTRFGLIELPEKVRAINVTIFDKKECKKMFPRSLRTGMQCAGVVGGGKDMCKGDFGGPLAHNGFVIGVASWTPGCGSVLFPGMYTRVSHYIEWIEKTLKG